MKIILTIIATLFISFSSQAQENEAKVIVSIKTETIVLAKDAIETVFFKNETKVARLYLDKNYKVKKELAFRTKNNASKLA